MILKLRTLTEEIHQQRRPVKLVVWEIHLRVRMKPNLFFNNMLSSLTGLVPILEGY